MKLRQGEILAPVSSEMEEGFLFFCEDLICFSCSAASWYKGLSMRKIIVLGSWQMGEAGAEPEGVPAGGRGWRTAGSPATLLSSTSTSSYIWLGLCEQVHEKTTNPDQWDAHGSAWRDEPCSRSGHHPHCPSGMGMGKRRSKAWACISNRQGPGMMPFCSCLPRPQHAW